MKILVRNLSVETTEAELLALFREYGDVQYCKVVLDRVTGKSKGFGFVEMATDAEAQSAINSLNGNDYDGRPMKVNESKPQEKRSGGQR